MCMADVPEYIDYLKNTSFENDKSNILSDYQLALENDWINELKLKYSVWVNRKVLKKLKKLYDL